jgi:hypothetical protein
MVLIVAVIIYAITVGLMESAAKPCICGNKLKEHRPDGPCDKCLCRRYIAR